MKLLGQIIQGLGVGCHQYADDTQLFISLPTHSREAVEVLELCLEAVGVWMRVNKLKLNPEKTEVLLVIKSLKQVLIHLPVLNGGRTPPAGAGTQHGNAPGLTTIPREPGDSGGQDSICPPLAGAPAAAIFESIRFDHRGPCPSDF